MDQLVNGQSGKFTASANAKISAPSNSVVEASANADVEFTLDQNLFPTSLQAKIDERVSKAEGSFNYLSGFHSEFRGDVAPSEVKEISESVYRDEQLLGQVKLTGPLDLAKKEGQLTLTVGTINRPLFSLIGAATGVDFGTTALNSQSTITLKNEGTLIAIKAQASATNFTINPNAQPDSSPLAPSTGREPERGAPISTIKNLSATPPLNITGNCDITIDLKNNSVQIQTLSLDGDREQRPVLQGSLTQPMTITWGNNSAPASDSVFQFAISNLNLPQWQAPDRRHRFRGRFHNESCRTASHEGGKKLDAAYKSHVAGLTAEFGGDGISEGALDCPI